MKEAAFRPPQVHTLRREEELGYSSGIAPLEPPILLARESNHFHHQL